MRKYHRWLSILFGVFLLWISATGVLSQIGALVNNGGFEKEEPRLAAGSALIPAASAHEPEAAAAAPATFTCPANMICRPRPKPGAWDTGYLHHLHSGEEFGPVGTIVSLMSGLALLFFALSGLYMYIQMFRARGRRERAGSRFFWK